MQQISQTERIAKSFFNLKTYRSLKQALLSKVKNKSELHVFGTTTLAIEASKQFSIRGVSIDKISQSLFQNFRSAKTGIYLQAKLREAIVKGNYEHKGFLIHRLTELVATFYVFAEFNVNKLLSPKEDLRSIEIIQLLNILLDDPHAKDYHLKKESLTKEEISFILCGHTSLNKIIFYEIEYLNFLRMSLIHWLKSKGFTIEFNVPYDQTFQNSYKYWSRLYHVVTKQELAQCEIIDEPFIEAGQGVKFGLFNEGEQNIKMIADREDVEVIDFPSPNSFQQYVKHKKDERIFAIDSEDVAAIVDQSKANIYEDEFGKFVYFLQFCEHKNENIYLQYNTFVELLTSGWIHTSAISGKKSLALISDLQEYMEGIESIHDILERLNRLQELEIVSRSFDRENSKDSGRNQYKRYMLNPFRAFSFLHQERYEITIHQLVELVIQLEKVCKFLVIEEERTINVNDYFKRWQHVLNNASDNESKGSIEKLFQQSYPDNWEFSIPELLSLIFLEAESLIERDREIYPESRLQEFMLNDREIESLHITNLTFLNFPQIHHTPISEFFDYRDLKELINHLQFDNQYKRNLLLHSLWVDFAVKECFEELSTYQLFNVLAHYRGKVKFSWINHMQENNLKSVYLDILADLYCSSKITTWDAPVSIHEFNIENEEKEELTINIGLLENKIPDLYWLDHDFCAKKFYLTALIEKQPIYSSDFHQQFIFSKIGKLFSYSDAERENFRTFIYPLFPHWTDTKKGNLIDMEYKTLLTNFKNFENISYPKEMRGLQILRSVYLENRRRKARNQYRNDGNYHEKKLLEQFMEHINEYDVQAEPGSHCKMCPHLSSCLEGVYSIDSIN